MSEPKKIFQERAEFIANLGWYSFLLVPLVSETNRGYCAVIRSKAKRRFGESSFVSKGKKVVWIPTVVPETKVFLNFLMRTRAQLSDCQEKQKSNSIQIP